MMEIATWISIAILGPGSIAIFVWFLFDLKRIFRQSNKPPPPPSKGGARGGIP